MRRAILGAAGALALAACTADADEAAVDAAAPMPSESEVEAIEAAAEEAAGKINEDNADDTLDALENELSREED